jgi:hypothetical protein
VTGIFTPKSEKRIKTVNDILKDNDKNITGSQNSNGRLATVSILEPPQQKTKTQTVSKQQTKTVSSYKTVTTSLSDNMFKSSYDKMYGSKYKKKYYSVSSYGEPNYNYSRSDAIFKNSKGVYIKPIVEEVRPLYNTNNLASLSANTINSNSSLSILTTTQPVTKPSTASNIIPIIKPVIDTRSNVGTSSVTLSNISPASIPLISSASASQSKINIDLKIDVAPSTQPRTNLLTTFDNPGIYFRPEPEKKKKKKKEDLEFHFGSNDYNRNRLNKKPKVKSFYSPSIEAIVYNKKGKRPKLKDITGLELRPL